ncbi:MAG: histidine--tRNA ligase, partial [Candidatus Kariarchaeaceae archaeon]
RAEKPQKGRLREFYQCDIDVIGTRSLISEAEIAKIIVTVFSELGFRDFTIKVNSRRLLNNVLESFNIAKEQIVEVIRIIDKMDKIGKEGVRERLEVIGVNQAKDILKLLKPSRNTKSTIEKLSDFNLTEIKDFFQLCDEFSIPDKYLEFDPSLARGLDYYTGISYEVISSNSDFGTLCAGGRYDDLCSLFCDEDFSGVGVAFGFERIMLALQKMEKLNSQLNSTVLVTLFDEQPSSDALSIYSELIKGGINAEIYFEPLKLSRQLKYANQKQIPFVLIRGPEEIKKDEVNIKSMKSGKQKSIPRNQLISYFTSYYET